MPHPPLYHKIWSLKQINLVYLDAIAVARFKKVLVNFMFKYQKLLIYARFDVFLSQILLLHSLVMHLGNCPRETTNKRQLLIHCFNKITSSTLI